MLESSVVSYPERGPYGDSKYRGNTTGYLVRDLLLFYKAKSVLDPMEGSGTTRDVCKELGLEYDGFDLRSGFDVMTDELPPKQYDLVFLHPPYWQMVRYSDDSRDLSNAEDFADFMDKMLSLLEKLSEYLSENGKLAVLVGDMRRDGQIYPIGAYLQVFHRQELKDKLIKVQRNVLFRGGQDKGLMKSAKTYWGRERTFVPLMHEEVLIFRAWRRLTWADLVLRVLQETGGEARLSEVYEVVAKHPKTATNPTWRATVRRTLQQNAQPVERGVWATP